MAKATKRSVRYRFAWWSRKRCGSCSMFRPKPGGGHGTCTLVAGQIRAAYVCDRWEARQ